MKKKVLFHRHYRKFQGAHLSFWHYYRFVQESSRFEAQIHFSSDSLWDASNPWLAEKERALTEWEPEKADILVLGLVDWPMLSVSQRLRPPCPIIHPVLGTRVADTIDEVYPTLKYRAVRICPSEETARTILDTGIVNGPVFVVPHGIDTTAYPKPKPFNKRSIELLIAGLKNPSLAGELKTALKDSFKKKFPFYRDPVEVLTDLIPRQNFLEKLSDAKMTLFLPNPKEGFYRPILEGMALETLCLSPRFLGKCDRYVEKISFLTCDYKKEELLELCRQASKLSPLEIGCIIAAGKKAVLESSIEVQRDRFLDILDRARDLY
jgi:hypothetical protein